MTSVGSNHAKPVTLVAAGTEPLSPLLVAQLEQNGSRVVRVQSAKEAMEWACRPQTDLLLLDLDLEGMDGLELLRRIRKDPSSAGVPVILLASPAVRLDPLEVLRLGADDWLTKPVEFAAAAARIHTQVRRKRAEAALRESEERYLLAASGIHDGLWDWDLRTNQVYFSPRWKQMLGLADSEVGNSLNEVVNRIHPEDVEKVKAGIQAHLAGQTPHFESEHRILHKDGFYRWMFARGLALRDSRGRPRRMAGSHTDITAGKVVDPLTGLPGRSLFMDRLGHALERAKRRASYLFAILFLDLDRFKTINDSLGHSLGDLVILSTARRLQSCLRPTDTVARCGADQFVLLVDDIRHVSDATRVAERISNGLAVPFNLNGREVFVSASIGIALSATGYERSEDLFRDAELAMRRSKSSGQCSYEVFDAAMRERTLERLQLETDLRRALERQEFCNHYQPIVSLADNCIAGFEALVRWRHPVRGLVPPGEFIPLAEETGMIVPLGKWVLREACRQMRAWHTLHPELPPMAVSVNLSSKQLMEAGLAEQVDKILQEAGLAPKFLRLEITESMIMENADAAISRLAQLRSLGVHLSIDDFGTGYSSLSCLQSFPVDTLKIDRSFVNRMGPAADQLEIVRTIVTLAHNLGMDVTAEGVEGVNQLEALRRLGCEYAQGYYFSRPLDAESAGQLLARGAIVPGPAEPAAAAALQQSWEEAR